MSILTARSANWAGGQALYESRRGNAELDYHKSNRKTWPAWFDLTRLDRDYWCALLVTADKEVISGLSKDMYAIRVIARANKKVLQKQ